MYRQRCHGNDCLQVLLPVAMPGNVWIWNRLLPQVRLLWLPRHQLEEKIIIFITLVKYLTIIIIILHLTLIPTMCIHVLYIIQHNIKQSKDNNFNISITLYFLRW